MALYADVVEVIAPDRAAAGSTVNVSVRIKNFGSETISIMAGGALEYGVTPWPGVTFPNYWANVGPGETHTFQGYFIMPGSTTQVHGYSYWYGSDGLWHFDDELVKAISLMESVYEFVIGTPTVSAA